MGGGVSIPDVSLSKERVIVITGGNAGIGYEAAKNIAMLGASVIIACRSEVRATEAIEKMNAEFKEAKAKGQKGIIQDERLNVEQMSLDLSSLKSVMDFVATFKATGKKLHVLMCNAGIAMGPRGHTEDGFESHFHVNYLGHFLIIAHLLPIMQTSGDDCRIVFTSSSAHKYVTFNLATSQAKNEAEYGRFKYYGFSKLYQVQHMFCLNRRLQNSNVTVTSLHPGLVTSEIKRNYEDLRVLHSTVRFIEYVGISKSTFQGGMTLVDAAVNPTLKGVRDIYFVNCKPASISSDGRNEEYQEALWKYSVDCLKDYLTDGATWVHESK